MPHPRRQGSRRKPQRVSGSTSVPTPTPKKPRTPQTLSYDPNRRPGGGSVGGLNWNAAKSTWDFQTGKYHRKAVNKAKEAVRKVNKEVDKKIRHWWQKL